MKILKRTIGVILLLNTIPLWFGTMYFVTNHNFIEGYTLGWVCNGLIVLASPPIYGFILLIKYLFK